jgi:tRNA (guanine37-N1)-methyltransferase
LDGGNVRFVILTLFPEFFESPLKVGLLGKAIENGLLQCETVQIRDFATDKHKTVDDTPFGGGPGMVMKADVVAPALEHAQAVWPSQRTILLSPRGTALTQEKAAEIAAMDTVHLLCGRYEGVDERIIECGLVDEELSLGDFVLAGGEVAALTCIEAVSRLVEGVVGNEQSVENDSFYHGLLDHPHYTRPREFRGVQVPDVLLSGNHAEIDRWRTKQSLEATRDRRPDLLERLTLSDDDWRLLEQ